MQSFATLLGCIVPEAFQLAGSLVFVLLAITLHFLCNMADFRVIASFLERKKREPSWLKYLRNTGSVSVLITGAGMLLISPTFFPYFVAGMYAAIIFWGVDLIYRVKGFPRTASVFIGIVLALVIFTRAFVWIDAPLSVDAFGYNVAYETGHVASGIPWDEAFYELHIFIENRTDYEYRDIHITVKPDKPVAAIAQSGGICHAQFEDAVNREIMQADINLNTGEARANPIVVLASSGGKTVYCDRTPPGSHIDLILALANVASYKKQGTIFDSDFVLRQDMHDDGTVWFGHGGYYGLFVMPRPIPQSVTVNCNYVVLQRIKKCPLNMKIPVLDAFGRFTAK